jgi:hypothetical protein
MQIPHLRNKFNLHWRQVVILCLMVMVVPISAQNNPSAHLPDYDDHFIHYGFLLGVHSAKYRIQYADIYGTPEYDTLHSVVPGNMGGFKLGFVVNFHLLQHLDFRILPTVGFYENDLTYRYTNRTEQRYVKDATIVELPLLLKYKSQRRGNYALYLIGGIKPSFEAVGRGQREDSSDKLDLIRNQINIEIGVGFDIYNPLFKFSPEIRYSYGVRNMLSGRSDSPFNAPLKKLTTHNITFYVTFEGGPSTLTGGSRRRGSIKTGAPRKPKKVKIDY